MNEQTSFGLVTTLEVKGAISAKGSCWSNQGLLLANYVYNQADLKSDYTLTYTYLDELGNTTNIVDDQASLPCLFLSPCQENYVSVVRNDQDKEYALCKPVTGSNQIGLKTSKDYKGRFVGTLQDASLFYEVDLWKQTKADTLRVIQFQDKVISKENKIPIALPKDNKVWVDKDQIHLITEIEQGWLHREIDKNGKELRRRILEFDFPFVHEALHLSFDSNSYLLCEENGQIGIVEIDSQGNGMYGDLFDIKDEFFGTWHPQKIDEKTTAVQFTTEYGNGWLVIREDQLVEIFYNKNKSGYKNLLTKETLSIDNNDLVLSSISAMDKGRFAIVFYPRVARKQTYNKIFVLQRSI
ncbi:hypothetical protein [Myroides sp. LJL119]